MKSFTQRSISVFKQQCYWTVSWTIWILSTPSHSISLWSILKLSSHPRLHFAWKPPRVSAHARDCVGNPHLLPWLRCESPVSIATTWDNRTWWRHNQGRQAPHTPPTQNSKLIDPQTTVTSMVPFAKVKGQTATDCYNVTLRINVTLFCKFNSNVPTTCSESYLNLISSQI
jgi:hypothetical protein